MNKTEAGMMLDLIVEKAPKLRAAGVVHVSLEGASFTLGDLTVAATGDAPEEADDDMNPLSDPTTFGMRAKKGRALPTRGGKP